MSEAQAIGAEVRQVGDGVHDGNEVRIVAAVREFPVAPMLLWAAITDPDRLAVWFSPIEGDFEAGGRFHIEGNARGEILRCDTEEALDLTWEFADNVSWVLVRLTKTDKGTRLRLEHRIPKDDTAEGHWAHYGPGATGVGWDLSFYALGRYLEGDRPSDEAWLETDAGLEFLVASAQCWRAAHVEAGEDAEVAAGMAERTSAFYTG